MKKQILSPLIIIAASVALFFSACKETKNTGKPVAASAFEKENEEYEEENWKGAAEFEFKMTRDISLGYVPKYRLLEAGEGMKMGRFARSGANRAAALTWTERGPKFDDRGAWGNPRPPGVSVSGRLDALCVDKSDPTGHTVWVGSRSGGIWKTNDISIATPAWVPVYDMMGNLGISSICQTTVNNNIIYAGTGDKYNGGSYRGGGVWKSTDHGVTWNLLPSTTNFYNITKIESDAAGNVYVASNGSGAGVQRSADGGLTWVNISPNGLSNKISDMALSSTGRLHVYCGFNVGSTSVCGYRYTDNPSTVTSGGWTAPVTSFPLTRGFFQFSVNGTRLIALPSNENAPNGRVNKVYLSSDGGANWAEATTSPDLVQDNFVTATFNASDPQKIMAAGLNCFLSTDGGTSWTLHTDGSSTVPGRYVHSDFHHIIWNGSQVYMASDGGVYYSSDNGLNYLPKNEGLRTFEFYSCAIHPTLTDYFIGGTQDNGNQQFTKPGLDGTLHITGGDGGFAHIDQNEPAYQFCTNTFNQHRRSTDGGLNWPSVTYSITTGQFINPTDYDDVNNKMYCAGNVNELIRWEDPQTGSAFTPISIPAFGGGKISALSVSPYITGRLYTATENGKIIKLDNAGAASPSITDITGAGMPVSYISSVNIGTDDNNLIRTYSNYGTQHVWITSNGGTSWINVMGNLPDMPVRWGMFHPDDNDRAIIATDLGVWTTDDLNGAATVWTPETGLPSVRCNMLQYRASDRTLAVATYGRGIWTTTLPPLRPYIRFAAPNFLLTKEGASLTNGCRSYKNYTISLNIDMPPAGDATVNLQVAGGATAAQGSDFDFTTNGNFASPSSQLVFPSGSAASRSFTLRIYDDAAVEGPESLKFIYTITGTTNAVIAAVNNSYQVSIADNDADPVAPASFTSTIGVNTQPSTFQPFRGSFQKSRNQFIYLASELTAAGFIAGPISSIGFFVNSKQSTAPYNGLTISLKNTATASFPVAAFETGTTPVYTGNYSTVAGMNTFNCSTPFNWDGTSNLLVEMCYDNPAASADDNINGTITTTCMGTWARTNTGVGCSLAATNRTFGSTTFAKPDITINGQGGKEIESTQGSNVTEYAFGNGNHCFYTNGNGKIISRLSNLSADLGCVSATVYEAGNVWQAYYGGQRSQKVIEVIPSQNTTASHTIGLYFTAAELNGLSPSKLQIAKTTAVTMSGVSQANTVTSATTVTPYGTGYLFTAPFTGFGKFFLVNQISVISLDASLGTPPATTVTESTSYSRPVCTFSKQYVINMNIDNAPIGDAVVTLTVDGSSTATQGIDYDFTTNGQFVTPSNTFVFPSGSSLQKTITLEVYDDGETEIPETVKFNIAVTGTTNATLKPGHQTFTLTILDNDPVPVTAAIETAAVNSQRKINSSGAYYFYSSNGNIIGNIKNASSTAGCTTVYITFPGITWQPYGTGSRSQKIIAVFPTSTYVPSFTIGLYFTAAELAGKNPASLRICKNEVPLPSGLPYLFREPEPALIPPILYVSAAATSYITYGDGYLFTATFTGGTNNLISGKYYLIDDKVTVPMVPASALTVQNANNTLSAKSDQTLSVTNPFTNQLRIQFAKPPQGDVMLQLLTGDGRTVLQKKLTLAGQTNAEINLPTLAKGEYFLAVLVDNRRYLKKLIKQ